MLNAVNKKQKKRDFELEVFFSKWEFKAKYHATASDIESISMSDLLAMATPEDKEAFDTLWLGYTETWGAPELREHIAATYKSMNATNIVCLAGAGEGIYIAMRVLLDASDHAIVVVPNYQSAETIPLDICSVTGVALHESNNWRLDLSEVENAILPTTKLISINFPNNPTGAVMPKEDLDGLIALCRKHNLYLFSDEVFRLVELNDADRIPQIADIYEKGLSLNVMSKAYGMPGLRIGWIASQDTQTLQAIERYKHYLSICNSAPSEHLAIIALKNRERILERNRGILRKNITKLDAFFEHNNTLFSWNRPQGSCIAFPRYLGNDGVEAFCKSLLLESGVLLLPSSIYTSELLDAPSSHFRIGFGRQGIIEDSLDAMQKHINSKYL